MYRVLCVVSCLYVFCWSFLCVLFNIYLVMEFYSWTASQLIFFVLFWYFFPCVFYFVVYSKLESWASVHLILLACYFLSVVFVVAIHGICCYFCFCYFRLPAWCTVKFLISVLCIKFLCLFSVVCLSFCSVFFSCFSFLLNIPFFSFFSPFLCRGFISCFIS